MIAKLWENIPQKPKLDPILISLVREAAMNATINDICGVQPMNGPTGLIFKLKVKDDE